jgi:hypothetical protein
MIKTFSEFIGGVDKVYELTYNYIYRRTPKRYKERANDIEVKLITVKRGDKYFYETKTLSSGNKHKQWIMPLYNANKVPFRSLQDHVIAHCNCNDFRYENEWLLWSKNASNLISSNREAPKKLNPERIPKFCKHLVAIKSDLYDRLRKKNID